MTTPLPAFKPKAHTTIPAAAQPWQRPVADRPLDERFTGMAAILAKDTKKACIEDFIPLSWFHDRRPPHMLSKPVPPQSVYKDRIKEWFKQWKHATKCEHTLSVVFQQPMVGSDTQTAGFAVFLNRLDAVTKPAKKA